MSTDFDQVTCRHHIITGMTTIWERIIGNPENHVQPVNDEFCGSYRLTAEWNREAQKVGVKLRHIRDDRAIFDKEVPLQGFRVEPVTNNILAALDEYCQKA